MIPLCLVTGFLGSGKTSFLRHLIERHSRERIVYLVNEFSSLDVDGALLGSGEDDVIAIPGGSIFCRCLVTQFVGNLKLIPERFGAGGEPISGVVIEASGIANPAVVEQMLAETGLEETYELATIVSVVDPGSLPRLVHTLPNVQAQVEAADVVLLNKIDLFSAEEAAEAERIVREIAPEASVIRTIHCRADLEIFAGGRIRGLEGEYAPCADPNYAHLAIDLLQPVEIDALRAVLEEFVEDIYRAKGIVPTTEGDRYLDISSGRFSIERAHEGSVMPGLVVIAGGEAKGRLTDLAERLAGMTPETAQA